MHLEKHIKNIFKEENKYFIKHLYMNSNKNVMFALKHFENDN